MTRAIERRTVSARVMPFPPPVRRDDLEVWTDTRYQLLVRVRQAVQRGEVAEAGRWAAVPGAAGWYSVEMRRLKPAVPAWRRRAGWVAAGLALLGAVVAAIGWAIASAVAAVATVPVVAWVVLGVLLLAGGGGATTVIVKVVVR